MCFLHVWDSRYALYSMTSLKRKLLRQIILRLCDPPMLTAAPSVPPYRRARHTTSLMERRTTVVPGGTRLVASLFFFFFFENVYVGTPPFSLHWPCYTLRRFPSSRHGFGEQGITVVLRITPSLDHLGQRYAKLLQWCSLRPSISPSQKRLIG